MEKYNLGDQDKGGNTVTATSPLNALIPVLSLVIALLAVFVGPLVTLRIGRKQIEISRRIANKQIVAPMRQAWINTFREKLAELTSRALHYHDLRPNGEAGKTEKELRSLTQLKHKI